MHLYKKRSSVPLIRAVFVCFSGREEQIVSVLSWASSSGVMLGGLLVCLFFFFKNDERLQAEMVTWPSASCGVCVPAAPSGDVQKKGREPQQSGGEVACSGATGRGLDDAKLQALFYPGGERQRKRRERQTCRRQRRVGTHPLL